jgi:hypothetical protein
MKSQIVIVTESGIMKTAMTIKDSACGLFTLQKGEDTLLKLLMKPEKRRCRNCDNGLWGSSGTLRLRFQRAMNPAYWGRGMSANGYRDQEEFLEMVIQELLERLVAKRKAVKCSWLRAT